MSSLICSALLKSSKLSGFIKRIYNLFRSLALSISFFNCIFSPLTLLYMLNHWTGADSCGSYYPTGFG